MAHRILLADDNPTARSMASGILASEGYEVLAANDAEQAGNMVGEFRPGLIVADVHMPGGGGVALCEAVRSFPATAQIPVLLAAGRMDRFTRADATAAGAQGLVSKPFEASALLLAVAALLPPPKGKPRRDEDFDQDDDSERTAPETAREYESAWQAATEGDEPLFVSQRGEAETSGAISELASPSDNAQEPPELAIAGTTVHLELEMAAASVPRSPSIFAADTIVTEEESIPWL